MNLHDFAINLERPGNSAVNAEDCLRQLCPSRTHEASHSNHLARMEREIDTQIRMPGHHQIGNLKHRRSNLMFFVLIELRQRSAHHQRHHALVVNLVARQLAAIFAVSEDDHAVGNLTDLHQAMGDVDDTNALGFQAADKIKEAIRFVLRQAARRLIHDNHPGVLG